MPPRSKIAQLPQDLRAWLHKALVDRAFGDIVGITEELNALCKEGGVAISVGKSAVGVEAQRIKRAQEAIHAATESAKLIAEASRDDADARGEAVMALISSDIFECLLQARESEATEDPLERMAIMAEAAKSAARLSRARVLQSQWRVEVEKRVQAAAEKAGKLASKGGASAKTVEEIKRAILGISPAPKDTAVA